MGMDSSKYGGLERFNVCLSKALADRGFKGVFVYEEYPVSQSFVDDIVGAGGEIIVFNSRENPLHFCKGFVRLLKKYRPAVVHAHFTKARFYAIPIAYFMGIRRLFMTIHSTMVPKREIKFHTRIWCWWANKVAKTVAVSDDIASVCKANWPKAEVRRIYLGVSQVPGNKAEAREKLGIPPEQTMLLTVSNFNHVKGLDVLCKAIKALKDGGHMAEQTCLYIVGQPDADREALIPLMESLGIQNCVKMVGITNEVPTYLSAADIYIQSSRHEGLPLALMEAASAALPLVGTRVGGIPEIAREGCNALLVEAEDAGALAHAIGELMRDKELRKRLGENSLKVFKEAFSVENGVKQTILYYGL